MSRAVVVLRPEPGNRATVTAVRADGLNAVALPLFAVAPVAWTAPDADRYDALLISSANAIRHGGDELDKLKSLPVVAVGEASAAAAREAGFAVHDVGRGGVAAIVARAAGKRLLHLAGRDRVETGADTITVYASDPLPVDPAPLLDGVALLHSARAAARLAEIAPDRSRIAIAALSLNVARAAGDGWQALAIAGQPTTRALIDAARTLAD